jgi:hypothetical protein
MEIYIEFKKEYFKQIQLSCKNFKLSYDLYTSSSIYKGLLKYDTLIDLLDFVKQNAMIGVEIKYKQKN